MVRSPAYGDTLGSLVQAYVREQCRVVHDARLPIASRDESVVHPVRVAIRRLRATLRTFRGVYDADVGAGFATELRWAGLLLGELRDLQVLSERFDDPGSSAGAAAHLIAEEIERDRADSWDRVTEALNGARGAALYAEVARWHDDPPFDVGSDRPADRALQKIEKTDARLRTRLRRARAASAAGDPAATALLHSARKAGKRHRYAIELAEPVMGAGAVYAIERSKALQDALGEHQDAVVALAFLRRLDGEGRHGEAATALSDLIARTRESADDTAGVISEVDRIRG
ncbi:CHAD domain-containing protein [Microbacterium terregens]|uniref:CHAD domain-containing protein n=1 Tax=Microbacterium terregens TaxID=69363 RepID=A0ABV5T468_9MICO